MHTAILGEHKAIILASWLAILGEFFTGRYCHIIGFTLPCSVFEISNGWVFSMMIQRTLISLFVAVIIAAVVFMIAPTHHYVVRGMLLPTNASIQPAISIEKVTVMPVEEVFSHQPLLATLSVVRHYVQGASLEEREKIEAQMKKKAKQMAAKIGANTVLITEFGYNPNAIPPGLAVYLLTAKAVQMNAG